MSMIKCATCNSNLSLPSLECTCDVPNLIKVINPVLASYIELYSIIAKEDLQLHLQDISSLEVKADYDLAFIEKHFSITSGMRILEIGPGHGNLAQKVRSRSHFFCMDIVPDYLATLSVKTFLGNIENAPEGLYGFFDLIIACDVFEHVLNEGKAWEQVYKLLKPGGRFYIRVPNLEPLIHYANEKTTKYPFVHLRSYSKQIIRANAYNHQFKVIQIKTPFFGKFSYAKRNFKINFFYRRNAKNLRIQLGFEAPNSGAGVLEKHAPKTRSRLIRGRTYKILNLLYSSICYRGTEICAMLVKDG